MEPCLTASIAYYTWKSFPWGDQVVQSKSYNPLSILIRFLKIIQIINAKI